MALLNHIGGSWVGAGATIVQRDPSTGDVLCEVARSGSAEVQEAVAAARAAAPAWAGLPAPARGEILFRAASIVERDAASLARSIAQEVGKPIREAAGEVARCAAIFRFFAGEARRAGGSTIPSDTGDMIMTLRGPVGVAALITPWNFPLAIPAWKLGPALVMGNTVVLKPAEQASRAAGQLVAVLAEAGLPGGALNVVMGDGAAGAALLDADGVDAISFTGSAEVGAVVRARAAARGVRVQTEMGGKNVAIVLPDANLARAAAAVATGAFGFGGQKCTATGLCLVHQDVAGAFADALVEATDRVVVGSPLDDATVCGPLIEESAKERALAIGAGLVGERGYFVAPTVLPGVDLRDPVATQEQFVPVLPLAAVGSLDEALAIAEGLPTGLSAGIHTNDASAINVFLRQMRAGVLAINRPTTGIDVQAPFGGLKASGSEHKEQGTGAVDFYSEIRTAYWSA